MEYGELHDRRSIWVDVQSWLIIVGFSILLALSIVGLVLGIIIIENGTVRHIEVDKHSGFVSVEATSSSAILEFPQPVTFDARTSFVTFFSEYLKTGNATVGTLTLTNQTSGATYNVDQVIEMIIQEETTLDEVLGMPELQSFIALYYNETSTLMKRRSLTRGPNVATFLYDTQNNITTLQETLAVANQSFYANENFAYYPSVATVISASPSSVLVGLTSSGTFAQQAGAVLNSNTFSVTKAGAYIVSFNAAVSLPATPITVTVTLMIGSSAIATATLNWTGASTGLLSASQSEMVTLATTDVVKLTAVASTTGASIYTPGTQVSMWNIS